MANQQRSTHATATETHAKSSRQEKLTSECMIHSVSRLETFFSSMVANKQDRLVNAEEPSTNAMRLRPFVISLVALAHVVVISVCPPLTLHRLASVQSDLQGFRSLLFHVFDGKIIIPMYKIIVHERFFIEKFVQNSNTISQKSVSLYWNSALARENKTTN